MESKDVLLIHPPGPPTLTTMHLPPLGLAYLASSLEKNGVSVKIMDLNVEIGDEEKIKKIIATVNPKVVGISVTSHSLPSAIKLASLVKSTLNVPIVVGGPHINSDTTFIYRFKELFDYQVVGEGECVLVYLVKKIINNKKMNQKVFYASPVKDLDSLPFPAFHLLPLKRYIPFTAPLITSRGCPFRCAFCRPHTHYVRFRSVENVCEEIKFLSEKYNIKFIEFEDDNFTLNKHYVIKLFNEIRREKLDITWSCQTRCDLVDSAILKKMKKAGCKLVVFGVETFSERLRKEMGKNLPTNVVLRVVLQSKKIGVKVCINCLVGFPTETKKDLLLTLYYLKKLRPDFIFPSLLTPFPGTPVFTYLVRRGIIREDIWDLYAKGKKALPVSVSENFDPSFYIYFFVKLIRLSRIGISMPQGLAITHCMKAFPFFRHFIYRNKKFIRFICRALQSLSKLRYHSTFQSKKTE